jgi:hypothetical protein
MTKLAILGVLVGTLLGACVPYSQPSYRSYGYHGYHARYWRHHGYWRHGYWNNGIYNNSYIYVDPDVALPAGTVLPQTDASGQVILAPGMVAPTTTPIPTPVPASPIQYPVAP